MPGSVTGRVCFPGNYPPAMTLHLENLAGGTTEQALEPGQETYRVEELPPGDYVAYARTQGTGLAGLYSRAVPCVLQAGCRDHRLLSFEVTSGALTAGIDLCDWYHPPGLIEPGREPASREFLVTPLQNMNVFSGPGLAYPLAGLAMAPWPLQALGRSPDGIWLQVKYPPAAADQAWIYRPLLNWSADPAGLPLAPIPPLSTPAPPASLASSTDQFTPLRWSYNFNDIIVHFKGTIKDERRNPVNGFSILADNGTWSVLSHPTGASRHYPDVKDGEWDIVIFNPEDAAGWWTLTVVRYDCPGFEQSFNAQCKHFTRLSEDRVVKVIYPEGAAITADWVCHRDCAKGLYIRGYRP